MNTKVPRTKDARSGQALRRQALSTERYGGKVRAARGVFRDVGASAVISVSILWLFFPAANGASPTTLDPLVVSWLAAQTNIQSWSADFVQTRRLKSLTQPLTAQGHVWFAAPNRFRWELGDPPQTIAVRGVSGLLVIYPRLKRVESFPLSGDAVGPWKDALALLEAGFPRSGTELQTQYSIVMQSVKEPAGRVVLQPKPAAARRMIPQIVIEFDTRDFSLRSTELQFADGSALRNDFSHPVLNPPIEASRFSPQIPGDYKVVEPLKK